MDINKYFPTSKGYPNVKVYHVGHWYGPYYEFEFSGGATANNYDAFFNQLIEYNYSQFWDKVQNIRTSEVKGSDKNYRRQYQIRFILQIYNKSFFSGLKAFLENITLYVKPVFLIFGDSHDELLHLLNSLEVSYKICNSADISIEKIEWYWAGMHPNVSPKIRFDKITGHCVALGDAIGTPLYPNHRKALIDWFESYLASSNLNRHIKIEFLFEYFEMIDTELKHWVKLLADKFESHQITFKWYFYKDDDYELSLRDIQLLSDIFNPFSLQYEVMEWENFLLYVDAYYSRFKNI